MGDIVPLGKVLRDRMAGGQPLQSRLDGMRNSMQIRSQMVAVVKTEKRARRDDRRLLLSVMWFANGVGIAVLLVALWFFATGTLPW